MSKKQPVPRKNDEELNKNPLIAIMVLFGFKDQAESLKALWDKGGCYRPLVVSIGFILAIILVINLFVFIVEKQDTLKKPFITATPENPPTLEVTPTDPGHPSFTPPAIPPSSENDIPLQTKSVMKKGLNLSNDQINCLNVASRFPVSNGNKIDFLPGGQEIAVQMYDTVGIFNISNNTWPVSEKFEFDSVFSDSPYGPVIVTNSYDFITIKLLKSDEVILKLDANEYPEIEQAIFSDDGKMVVTFHAEFAYLWEIPSQKRKLTLTGMNGSTFSHNGQYLASVSSALDKINVWNIETGKIAFSLPLPSDESNGAVPQALIFSPDDKLLAFSRGKFIYTWDYSSSSQPQSLNVNVEAKRFILADNQTIFVGPTVWDLSSKNILMHLRDHSDAFDITSSYEGDKFATLSPNEVLIWQSNCPLTAQITTSQKDKPIIISAENIRKLSKVKNYPKAGSAAFSPSGEQLAVVVSRDDSNDEIQLLNSNDLSSIFSIPTQTKIQALAYTPEGGQLVACELFGALDIWDAKTFYLLNKNEIACGLSIQFSKQGRYLYTYQGREGYTPSLSVLDRQNSYEPVSGFLMGNDARITGEDDRFLGIDYEAVWVNHINSEKPALFYRPDQDDSIVSSCISPDGKYLFLATLIGNELIILDAGTGQKIDTFILDDRIKKNGDYFVEMAILNKDVFAITSKNGDILFYQMNQKKIIFEMKISGYIHSIGFSPDESYFYIISDNGIDLYKIVT